MAVDMMAAPGVSKSDARCTQDGRPSAEQAPAGAPITSSGERPLVAWPRPSPYRARPHHQGPTPGL